jgi:hypothetical protein
MKPSKAHRQADEFLHLYLLAGRDAFPGTDLTAFLAFFPGKNAAAWLPLARISFTIAIPVGRLDQGLLGSSTA